MGKIWCRFLWQFENILIVVTYVPIQRETIFKLRLNETKCFAFLNSINVSLGNVGKTVTNAFTKAEGFCARFLCVCPYSY